MVAARVTHVQWVGSKLKQGNHHLHRVQLGNLVALVAPHAHNVQHRRMHPVTSVSHVPITPNPIHHARIVSVVLDTISSTCLVPMVTQVHLCVAHVRLVHSAVMPVWNGRRSQHVPVIGVHPTPAQSSYSARVSNCIGGSNVGGDADCGSNRMGPICSLCMPNYHASTESGSCTACPSKSSSLALTIFFCILIAVAYVTHITITYVCLCVISSLSLSLPCIYLIAYACYIISCCMVRTKNHSARVAHH